VDVLEQLGEISTRNGRVCPQPPHWAALHKRLPRRARRGGGWNPAAPLILAAWWETSDAEKAARLREHLEWAAAHGDAGEVLAFLTGLRERDWHHLGE
jgi:hypothetical protein